MGVAVTVGAVAAALLTGALAAGPAAASSARTAAVSGARSAAEPAPPAVTLTGHAVLPAGTSVLGPTSGQFIGTGAINGVGLPFVGRQPVQGFSAVLPWRTGTPDGTYIALPDNGYGAIENSADFLLRAYRIRPKARTATAQGSGSGGMDVLGSILLTDPDHRVPFTIAHEFTDRVLTGADFDPESLQRDPDGSYWVGEEFGPSLLHVSATGRLLAAPYDVPDTVNGGELRSPQSGRLEEATALRTMNALADRARSLGGKAPLTVSPDFHLLAGIPGNPTASTRTAPDGTATASSALFDPAALLTAGFPTVPYTVDAPADIDRLLQARDARNGNRPTIAGIISDDPKLLYSRIKALRPDAIDPNTGLVDRTKVDLQAHRGGRALRPENTLGSFEVGLDNLATTLETDVALTRDGVPVLSHDPSVTAEKCRRADGKPYTVADQVLIRDVTLRQLQTTWICDKKLALYPLQDNSLAASPLATRFAEQQGLVSPFVKPTAQQAIDFTRYYAAQTKSTAPIRSANASAVHFNLETKTNPQPEYRARTFGPSVFAQKVVGLITSNGLTARADVQSFDFTELLQVQRTNPGIATVYLWGDTPYVPGFAGADGTNLAPTVPDGTSPWLPGLRWPYRVTQVQTPARVAQSGGFEGLGISADGRTLYPTLEKVIAGQPGAAILTFDTTTGTFGTDRWYYEFHRRADAAPDGLPGAPGIGFSLDELQILPARRGDTTVRAIALERDNTSGQAAVDSGLKRVYELAFDPARPGTVAATREVADLERIADPAHVAVGKVGDVGIGAGTFALPANTIEAVLPETANRLVVLNDNNFPFDAGRRAGTAAADEYVRLQLARPLGTLSSTG